MLTPRQNFIETITGGNPDRFVKQWEALPYVAADPWNMSNEWPAAPGEPDGKDTWGVMWTWPEDAPGSFPVHKPGLTVLEDIEEWKDVVKAPPLEYSDEMWKAAEEAYAVYDREQVLVGPMMFPGLFELTHNLMGMENAMCSFYTNPDEMHELIEFCTDWECEYVKQMGEHLHPDCVIHHDDWGSSLSTFLSPDMFAEFYLEPYKRLYGTYKASGFKYIIHHSDSFAATLVPYMIEMGIDVWQGGTDKNDIPALVKQYGGQIAFLTGIDNQICDTPNWTREVIAKRVREMCTACGPMYFAPCQTAGIDESTFPGVYDVVNEEIDKMSAEVFGGMIGKKSA